MTRILFIVGSLRKGSFNNMLAHVAMDAIGDRAEVTVVRPDCVPLLDQDIEFPTPGSVSSLRDMVLDSDGIWVFTPEYNHDIPGGLKNMLDWLSRPMSLGGVSAVVGKKVTISGVSGASATSFVRPRLSELLRFMRMDVVHGDGTGFALPRESFSTGEWTPDEDCRAAVGEQAEAFLKDLA